MKKRWKQVRGYPNYKVSNYGEVYSIRFNRILTPYQIKNQRQWYVQLHASPKTTTFPLHRLVRMHFDKYKLPKIYSIHLDQNFKNNKINNLKACTLGELRRSYRQQSNANKGYYEYISNGYKYFRSALKIDNKIKTLGYFKSKEEAQFAYMSSYYGIYNELPWKG